VLAALVAKGRTLLASKGAEVAAQRELFRLDEPHPKAASTGSREGVDPPSSRPRAASPPSEPAQVAPELRPLPATPAPVFTRGPVTPLVDLVPPPYARAVACAGPCARCGGDGSQPLLAGAALAREVTLTAGHAVARVGLWLSLPPGERALRLTVSGDALGLLALTAARAHDADVDRDGEAPWAGAALTGRDPLAAELRPPPAGIVVVSLAGLARGPGEGTLSLRLAASRGGCLAWRVSVRVRPAPAGSFDAAYLALDGDDPARLLRWVDAAAAALARAGRWRGSVRARVETRDARFEGPVRVDEVGVDGARWSLARAAVTRGEVTALSLWDPSAPEAAGVEVAPGSPCSPAEASAWAAGDDVALRDAWWRAAEVGAPDTLQALVGRLREPVSPRVVTAWERARGVRAVPCEARWLGRFARAPGERVYCRSRTFTGDEARACWPGRWGVA